MELGHRDIAVVFPPTDGNVRARARREGALNSLNKHCPDLPTHWTTEARYSIADGKEAVTHLLGAERRPTALLCGNDVLAVGALHAACQVGIRVPQDLSIIGIGDFKGSKEMEPALTTVRMPARSIGQIAGDQLAASIVQGDNSVQRTNCEITLLERASCAAL